MRFGGVIAAFFKGVIRMHSKQHAIEYIKNAGGVVKKERFIEDFDPIGGKLLAELIADGEVLTSTSVETTIVFIEEDDNSAV